jgi:hypothetical protein
LGVQALGRLGVEAIGRGSHGQLGAQPLLPILVAGRIHPSKYLQGLSLALAMHVLDAGRGAGAIHLDLQLPIRLSGHWIRVDLAQVPPRPELGAVKEEILQGVGKPIMVGAEEENPASKLAQSKQKLRLLLALDLLAPQFCDAGRRNPDNQNAAEEHGKNDAAGRALSVER